MKSNLVEFLYFNLIRFEIQVSFLILHKRIIANQNHLLALQYHLNELKQEFMILIFFLLPS